jgi:hypothetical protein
MNTGLQVIWNEAVISFLKVPPPHSFRRTAEDHKKFWPLLESNQPSMNTIFMLPPESMFSGLIIKYK